MSPLSPVVERPWALLTAHEFWSQATSAALLYGNFVGLGIDYDPVTGYPRQVMPVHPNDVHLMLDRRPPGLRVGRRGVSVG